MQTVTSLHGLPNMPVLVPANDALRQRPCRPCEYNLAAIARKLGLADRPLRTIIERVRLLNEKQGFPLPKTPRFLNGERLVGSRSIDARSIWDRDAVDLWFENDLPPQESRARVAARRAAVSVEMGRRALLLVASQ